MRNIGGEIMNIDFLVKLRDASQMIADACNEELEKTNPTKTETSNTKTDLEKILWIKTTGQKGTYERYPAFQQQPDTTNQNYMALLSTLKKQKFYQHNGLNYWLFNDKTTIGRKASNR